MCSFVRSFRNCCCFFFLSILPLEFIITMVCAREHANERTNKLKNTFFSYLLLFSFKMKYFNGFCFHSKIGIVIFTHFLNLCFRIILSLFPLFPLSSFLLIFTSFSWFLFSIFAPKTDLCKANDAGRSNFSGWKILRMSIV